MFYIIISVILATIVVLQSFVIRDWKKNAHECMTRYEECVTYFEKSVELCKVLINKLDEEK